MKKIFFSFLLIAFFFLPQKAFAAVNFSLEDKSTSTVKSASLEVNSGTDTLEEIKVTVDSSEDVTIEEVNSGTVACKTFTPTIGTAKVDIVCSFEEATVVDGIIANIIFTTESSDYSLSVNKTSLEIGDAEVGTIVNIGEVESTDEVTTTGTNDTTDTTLTTTTSGKESTSSNTTILGIDIMEYLPYILLGGSVILLISIVGVLLTRKKDDNETQQPTTSEPKVESTTQTTETPVKEPTLKDMVNSNNAPVVEPATSSVSMQEPATPSLDSAEQKDLQDLVAKESSTMEIPQMPPVQPVVEEQKVETTVQEQTNPMETPLSTPVDIPQMQEQSLMDTMPAPMESTPVQEQPAVEMPPVQTEAPIDLQALVNNEIQQIPTEAMQPETQNPIAPSAIEPSTPAQEDESLPPVPPQM
jgi:hypothetical protein